jgi:hypothetical protein
MRTKFDRFVPSLCNNQDLLEQGGAAKDQEQPDQSNRPRGLRESEPHPGEDQRDACYEAYGSSPYSIIRKSLAKYPHAQRESQSEKRKDRKPRKHPLPKPGDDAEEEPDALANGENHAGQRIDLRQASRPGPPSRHDEHPTEIQNPSDRGQADRDSSDPEYE